MKKILISLAVCLAAGCTNSNNEVQECAQSFLDAYLKNDHAGAAQMCSETFKPQFMQAMETFSNLNPTIKEFIVEECSKYKAEIISVEQLNESDTFNVNYRFVKVSPDSSTFDGMVMESTLKVAGGKVIKLHE